MARRRYVSTEISVDTRVNRLAQSHGDFAALLYTWMIPHADDQGALTADPEQLLFTVLPGRRDKTVEDVALAILGMLELGLLEGDGDVLRYPKSFHKYQSYIKEQRRESAQSSAERRTSAQPVAPVLSPVSVSSSVPFSPSGAAASASEAPPTAIAAPSASPPKSAAPVRVKGVTKQPSGPDLAPLFEAFKAADLSPPAMLRAEPTAAQELLRHYSAEQLAACWQDHASGDYGDDFSRRTLSFGYLANNNRVGNWLAWKAGPNGSNGHGENRQRPGRAGSGPGRADAGPGAGSTGEDDPFAKYVRRDPVPIGDSGSP
jgi:hypothetical protein